MSSPARLPIAAGLAVGAFLTWNVTNVGAVADPLAGHYGASLAMVGLLTTALFVTHFLVQLPAGRAADRFGSRSVALAAAAAGVAGNALLLVDGDLSLALLGRIVVGVGSGAGFVAGLDLIRAGGGGSLLQGVYGGSTMAGGGLALMIVPPLTDAWGWRAPYSTAAVLSLAAGLAALAAGDVPRVPHTRTWILWDRELVPIGLLQAATFGLAVIAGNWAVPLLERRDVAPAAAGLASGLILFAGVVTRPLGGALASHARRRLLVAASLVGSSAGAALLAAGSAYALSALGAFLLGVFAGLPFAALFAAAQRARPDAPGAAIAFVNAFGVLAILVGTPIGGLAFELPGDGGLAFAAIAVLAAGALLALRTARL